MNSQMGYYLIAVGVFLALVAAVAAYGYFYRRSYRTSQTTWETLVARLAAVNRENIQQVALDAIDPSGQPRTDDAAKELKPEEIWRLVGGMKGLEILERNSRVLIDMAFYLQKRYPEALLTAEELRIKAREIEWHVDRLRSAARSEALDGWFANYAQNTVAAYYLMTRRVLSLYEAGGIPMPADVRSAL
jgi:hypothetical protein